MIYWNNNTSNISRWKSVYEKELMKHPSGFLKKYLKNVVSGKLSGQNKKRREETEERRNDLANHRVVDLSDKKKASKKRKQDQKKENNKRRIHSSLEQMSVGKNKKKNLPASSLEHMSLDK